MRGDTGFIHERQKMKLTTEKIGEARIDIEVDGDGKFWGEFNDQTYSAKTRDELLELLKKAVKKATSQGAVDVTVLGLVPAVKGRYGYDSGPFAPGDGVVHAKLRSKHERQSQYLLLSDGDGERTKFQVSTYRRADGAVIARRLTLEEVREYQQLCETMRVAKTALEDFVGRVQIDPDKALKDATRPEPKE